MAFSRLSPIAMTTLGILLLEHCTTVTLTRYTQQRVDVPRAAPAVCVLLSELLKLVLSCSLELTRCGGLGSDSSASDLCESVVGRARDTLRLSVPALLYTVQNISIFVALGNLEVVAFQVLYQTKLLLTAVLSVVLLGRRLSCRQWLALAILTVGVVAVELSNSADGTSSAAAASPPPPPPLAAVRVEGRVRRLPAGPDARGLAEADLPGASALLGLRLLPASWQQRRLPPLPWSEHEAGADGSSSGLWDGGAGGVQQPGRGLRGADAGPRLGHRARGARREHREHRMSPPAGGAEGESGGAEGGAGKAAGGTAGKAAGGTEAGRKDAGGKESSLGAAAALLAAGLSSLAGVYFESVIKTNEKSPPSLWVRNVQLCVFTIPLAAYAVYSQRARASENGLLAGLDTPTLILIALNGAGGLLVAAVLKFGDSILKNFATSCSVILGTFVSVLFFDFKLTGQFVLGSALVVCSAYMYAVGDAAPAAPPEPRPLDRRRGGEGYIGVHDGTDEEEAI